MAPEAGLSATHWSSKTQAGISIRRIAMASPTVRNTLTMCSMLACSGSPSSSAVNNGSKRKRPRLCGMIVLHACEIRSGTWGSLCCGDGRFFCVLKENNADKSAVGNRQVRHLRNSNSHDFFFAKLHTYCWIQARIHVGLMNKKLRSVACASGERKEF